MSHEALERPRGRSELFSGLFFLAVGAAFAAASLAHPFGTTDAIGPGFMPMVLSVLLGLLGLAQIAVHASRRTASRAASPDAPAAGGRLALRAILCVTLALVLFAATVKTSGLVVAIPLLVAVAAIAEDGLSWAGAAIAAVILTALVAVVFVLGFGVNLPILPDLGS